MSDVTETSMEFVESENLLNSTSKVDIKRSIGAIESTRLGNLTNSFLRLVENLADLVCTV